MSLNNTYQRSVGNPFEALFVIKMKHRDDIQIISLLEQEYVQSFNKECDNLWKFAKQNILKIQAENQRYYNKHRKKARTYKEGDLEDTICPVPDWRSRGNTVSDCTECHELKVTIDMKF